jgi:phosphate-selective porin OprO/OprP
VSIDPAPESLGQRAIKLAVRARTLALAAATTTLLAALPTWAQEPPAEKKPPASAGSDGFSLQNESGDFRLRIRGYAHFDGRFYARDDASLATDTFLLRRARPIVQGSLGRYFDFSLMPDFGGGSTVLQDAWVEFKPSSKVNVRVGKLKSPVGLERLQSATAIHFAERALPTSLVPNRDLGLEIHGDLASGVVSYAAGVFDGAPDGGSVDGDANDGKDVAGRLLLSPFKRGKSALKDLAFGVSGTTGTATGALSAYRSPGQVSIVSLATGVTADGTRKRFSPQLSFYSGPFGLLAEYARSESKVKKADGQRFDYQASAWQVTATIVLTGDKASHGGLRPQKPFDPSKGQWGALELAARVHRLEIEEGSVAAGLIDVAKSAREISAWAVGLNWSLTRNVKEVVDFERSTFKGGAAGGEDRAAENVLIIRTQVSF